MSGQPKHSFSQIVLIITLYTIVPVLTQHSKLYADQCDAFTKVVTFEQKKDLLNSNIDVIKCDILAEAESFFETKFGRPYDKKICAIYLARSYYYYKEMDKAKKYINMAFNNIINMYDEKCSEIFYYKLLIDPDHNYKIIYQKLQNRSPDLAIKFNQVMQYTQKKIMHYLNDPWNNKPPYLAQQNIDLYKVIKHVSQQIERFNHIYNGGSGWKQTKDNVEKLYQILNSLNQVREIKDNETMKRYKSFKALKNYYEQVNKKAQNKIEKYNNVFSALKSLTTANNSEWKHPLFEDTEDAKSIVKKDLNITYESILVLLDNTVSMNKHGDSFRHSICKLADPKASMGNTYYFAPIGEPSSKWKVIDNSSLSFSSNIKELFTFEDRITDIDSSFQWIEKSDVFKRINKILIISDMKPDVKNTEKKHWVYDRNDLDNMKQYLMRLKRWCKKIPVTIALYGWSGDYNKTYPLWEIDRKYIENEWKEIERQINSRSLCENCERPIRSLLKKELDLIEDNQLLKVITLSEKSSPLNILCKFLPNNICSKQLKEKKSFSIRVDISPFLDITLDGSVKNQLPVFIKQHGVKRKIHLIDNAIHQGITDKHDKRADYHFRIMASDKGEPFEYPYLLATVQKNQNNKTIVEKKEENGSEILKKPVISRASKKDVLHWIGNEIKNFLDEYSIIDFPNIKDNIIIKIKNSDSSPIKKGYCFYVNTTFDDGDILYSKTVVPDDEGIISMKVPLQGISKFYMVNKEENIYIKNLSNHILLTEKVFTVTLPPKLYTTVNQSFNFNGSQPVGINLKIYMDKYEFFLIDSINCKTNDINEFYLLPGQYIFEAIPISPDYLSAFPYKRIDYKHNQKTIKIDFNIHILQDIYKDKWFQKYIDTKGNVIDYSEIANLAQSSAYFLQGLIAIMSSDYYSDNTKKEVIGMLKRFFYDFSQDRTMIERRLQRAMKRIHLVKKSRNGVHVIPDAYYMLTFLFYMYLSNGKSNSYEILGSRESKYFYNEWITYSLKAHHMINEELENILLIK